MDDQSIILQKLAALETDLRLLREDVSELKERGIPSCAVHYLEVQQATKRLDTLEGRVGKAEVAIGKKELLMTLFAAIGVGFGFFVKYLWGKL